MELQQINSLLYKIQGCTFASLDTETTPSPGIRKTTEGMSVILFTNQAGSGYEKMVKRRLEEIGKDPESFRLGDLPWGERIPNSPLIRHHERYYLQTICLSSGKNTTFIGDHPIEEEEVPWLRRGNSGHQNLPKDRRVVVRTFALDSIRSIRLMGEEVKAHEAA